MSRIKILSGILASIVLSSCTATRYLAENERYLSGASITVLPKKKFEDSREINNELAKLLLPKPNTKLLWARPNVWFYHQAGEVKKESGFRYWMKTRLGRKPVLSGDFNVDRIKNQIQKTLNNNGYFNAKINSEILPRKYTSSVSYDVVLDTPYHYNLIDYGVSDSTLNEKIRMLSASALIKPGDRYDLEKLKNERNRLEKSLRDLGYYYFDDDFLLFRADTTVGNKKVNIYLKLKENIPQKGKDVYYVNQLNLNVNVPASKSVLDTTVVEGIKFIQSNNEYRPEIIMEQLAIQPGKIYSKENELLTLNRLIQLDVFRFVNIDYQGNDSSTQLVANVNLFPFKDKSASLGLQAVSKTNSFIGPNLSLGFKNRNIFGGAESYELGLDVGYEVQIGRKAGSQPLNSYTIGVSNTMTVPRVISPFKFRNRSDSYVPQTIFRLGLSTQKRVNFFSLNSIDVSYGFKWRTSKTQRHIFNPFDVNYIQLGKISTAFDSVLTNNPNIRNSLQEQFILGTSYSYFYNSQNNEERELRGNFYFNGNINISGNVMHLAQSTLKNEPSSTQDPYRLLGLAYSQFLRTDIDFRYNYKLNEKSKIATRLLSGIGYALGNSNTLPYTRQFSAGGTTSIRAFRSRSVGPGTFQNPDSVRFIDQNGDIKLEANLEYRFPIIGVFRGAVFTDLGNIWTLDEDSLRPGSKFQGSQFISELAIGSGIGLRFDAEYFVIRLDMAFPLRIPYPRENERWVIGDIDFFDREWRNENLILNFGIGYPF